jgi:type I restriction enzyme S subunit
MNSKVIKTKLSNLAIVIQGQSPESIYYSDKEGTPFLQGNRTFGLLYPTIDTYTNKITKLVQKGDVLMSVRAPVGDLNIAPCEICIGRGLAGLRSKKNDNNFLFYALKYNIKNLLKQGAATTFDSVNKDIINDFVLIIPEDEFDRQKIATVLSSLDAKIELNNRINAELEAMAKTLYDYWFVQFDFPYDFDKGEPCSHDLDKDGKKTCSCKPYKSNGGKMVWNEQLKREIPEGWSTDKLSSLCDIYQPQTISEKEMSPDGKYYVFGANGIIGKYNKYNHDKSVIAVTCRGASCGKINVTQPFSWITGNAMVIKPLHEHYCIDYLFYTLLNNNISRTITGSAQPQITRSNLAPLLIIKPSFDILNKYKIFTNPGFITRINIFMENQKLSDLRDFLLPMLMNGQVKVV